MNISHLLNVSRHESLAKVLEAKISTSVKSAAAFSPA